MIKKVFFLLAFFGALFFVIDDVVAVPTYVGVRIINLTDDPAHSCVGQAGYPAGGRIQALSSIMPNQPIYMNLSRASDGAAVWDGNLAKNCSSYNNGCDYTIGDVMLIPNSVNLDSGVNYNLFMDVDAIRVYLPLNNQHSFVASADDNYWTAGKVGSGTSNVEIYTISDTNACTYNAQGSSGPSSVQSKELFFSSYRTADLEHSCTTDVSNTNCDQVGLASVSRISATNDFRIDNQYDNLYSPTVGNIQLAFQFP